MTRGEINKLFEDLISKRNWYKDTTINRKQAFELKNRFLKKELSFGRTLEVLAECGYDIEVRKH